MKNPATPSAKGPLAAQGAQAPAPAEGSALRLDKRTYLDSGHLKVNLRNYGNGLAEIGWSFVPALPRKGVGKGKAQDHSIHEKRAVRRARSRMRQLVLAARLDHMLTLTYRANVTSYAQACNDLSRFIRLVRVQEKRWSFLAVAEQQERGAWHWHIAVRGRQDVSLLREAWLKVVQDGNIDVKAPPGNHKQRGLAMVRYLSKYLGKGFEDGNRALNARRFRASTGILVPEQSLRIPAEDRSRVRDIALATLKAAAGNVGFIWDSDDRLAGWASSW